MKNKSCLKDLLAVLISCWPSYFQPLVKEDDRILTSLRKDFKEKGAHLQLNPLPPTV